MVVIVLHTDIVYILIKFNNVYSAQREGYLSEAHSEEVDQADPFYAHCKLHSDKTLVRKRKKNYLALELRNHHRRLQFQQPGFTSSTEQKRIQRKLEKYQLHYFNSRALKTEPWGILHIIFFFEPHIKCLFF